MKSIVKSIIILATATLFFSSCNKEEKKIAIINLMQHPVLDSVEVQTKKYLLKHGYDKEHGYVIIEKNLNGQKDLLPAVVNEINNQNPVLIVAITTPVAQAFLKKATCPVVFSLVTDPVEAGILNSLKQTKPNITGTSDVFPYEEQVKLIREIHPKVKTIGLLYDPGEASARFAFTQLKRICPKYGFELISKPATSSSEVPLAAKSLIGKAEIFFVTSDNTVIESVPALVSLCVKNKIPLYVGDTGSVEKGGIATCSVSYDSFGNATGKLADKLLKGEKNIPIYIPSEFEVAINKQAAELMNVQLPKSVIKRAKTVYKKIK
jgi:putative tryptophan/tyrosine transport system substrate-binding protein